MLSEGMPLLGSLSVPLEGFLVILFNTLTIFIANTQIALSTDRTIFCRLLVPFKGFPIAFLNAMTFIIAYTQIALSLRVSLLGCL